MRQELTTKYAAELFAVYDLDDSDFQSAGTRFIRRFPQWTLDFTIDYDDVESNVNFGFSVRPVGIANETRRHVFTRDDVFAPTVTRSFSPHIGRLNTGPFRDD